MASIVNDPGGRKRISYAAGGKRYSMRLGAVGNDIAANALLHVERLVACQSARHLLGIETLEWAIALPPKMYRQLAAAGLVPPEEAVTPVEVPTVTLAAFLTEVFATLRVKASTLTVYGHTRRCLLGFFGAERDVRTITTHDADAFHAWLASHDFAGRTLSPATTARRMLMARHLFHRATRWDYLEKNPFVGVKVGRQVNPARKVYVPAEHVQKVIDASADVSFRLVLALSRFAGLRCPSEHTALTWDDIDWEHGRMTVRSPKTEHHQGGECRVIPLFADLRPYLLAAFEAAPEGRQRILAEWSDQKNLRTRFKKAIARAGLKPWPKLFHNLRASCETDLVREYPIATVAEWLGHDPAVMVRNYLTQPDLDSDFQRASQNKATRIPTRKEAKMGKNGDKTEATESRKKPVLVGKTEDMAGAELGAAGFEYRPKQRDSGVSPKSDAPSDAPDSELEFIIAIWPRLDSGSRAALLKLARELLEVR